MTHAARRVLWDCRLAWELLESEARFDIWRVHWVAAVTLARAVGHVLQKVDGKDETVAKATRALFAEWKSGAPEHAIFREFIEAERNTVLKEYRSTVDQSETIHVSVRGELFDLGESLYRPITSGPWSGEDSRDVLLEAIEWWSAQLDRIDQLSRKPVGSPAHPSGSAV